MEQVTPKLYLIRFDQPKENVPSQTLVFHVSLMQTSIGPDGVPDSEWVFFSTRLELEAYLAWLFRDEEEVSTEATNVVRLQ